MPDESISEELKKFEYQPKNSKYSSYVPKAIGLSKKNSNTSAEPKGKSPSKVSKQASNSRRGYAPPEKYSHLKPLVPLLKPGLRCVFVGFNPGTMTALKGHYYAHPTNLFWKLMYESGCVDRPVTYNDDRLLPDEYGIGFTDLVARPTTGIEELSNAEMADGVPRLEEKISSCEPHMICIIGKGIWDTIYKHKYGKAQKRTDFDWGRQPSVVLGGCTTVFVLPSTSGLVAGVSRSEKLALWKQVAEYMNSEYPLRG